MTSDYPIYHKVDMGYKVQVSQGAYLPGVYTKFNVAQMAYNKHLGKKLQGEMKRKKK